MFIGRYEELKALKTLLIRRHLSLVLFMVEEELVRQHWLKKV